MIFLATHSSKTPTEVSEMYNFDRGFCRQNLNIYFDSVSVHAKMIYFDPAVSENS